MQKMIYFVSIQQDLMDSNAVLGEYKWCSCWAPEHDAHGRYATKHMQEQW